MSKERIIVADDQESIRIVNERIIEKCFPSFKDNVEFAENGNALESILNNGVDGVRLILLDNNMPPGPSGLDLITTYAPKLEKIPFVLFYAGDENIGQTALQGGAFSYILKPLGIDLFAKEIAKALQYSGLQLTK